MCAFEVIFVDHERKKRISTIFDNYDKAFAFMKKRWKKLEKKHKYGELNDNYAWLDKRYEWKIEEVKTNAK